MLLAAAVQNREDPVVIYSSEYSAVVSYLELEMTAVEYVLKVYVRLKKRFYTTHLYQACFTLPITYALCLCRMLPHVGC